MFQIDTPSAVPALPAPDTAGTPGYFGKGNVSTGERPTTLSADWANMVQSELLAIVLAGGETPSKTNHSQVLTAITSLISAAFISLGLPAGTQLRIGSAAIATGSNVTNTPITFSPQFPTACTGVIAIAQGYANPSWHPIILMVQPGTLSASGAIITADTGNGGQSIMNATNMLFLAFGD